MIMLSLFANLIYYPHIDELGVSQTRAGRVPDEWGEEPAQNINCYFFSPFFLSVCVSVTEFSEVHPPFFPPPIFSSVRVGG